MAAAIYHKAGQRKKIESSFLQYFAVWVFTPWYAKTFSGIIQCYLMALPFFKNTLLGDLFYVTVFFGTYEVMEVWIRKKFRMKVNPDHQPIFS